MRSGTRSRAASWFASLAAFVIAFYSLMSASALAGTVVSSTAGGATTIICTAAGPRVIKLDAGDSATASKAVAEHGNTLPHCCSGGCAMAGAAVLPTLYLLAWMLPAGPASLPDFTVEAPPAAQGLLASSPGRPRGPPAA
ncbi:hypothetical protein CAL29_13970 [Bordetella genomosp. 10]|uniref:DUF2946 domain-containing protein n=1 Tax=Bordetella genomosp. 10 TaxID=1416804 RepID=A0A261SC83_9BORD|nr:hypothetical protein [Bordetella genomosp. 10]OZI34597.1 hypothetical protein CAL29_13970 [Bordetella genomosp. 10]